MTLCTTLYFTRPSLSTVEQAHPALTVQLGLTFSTIIRVLQRVEVHKSDVKECRIERKLEEGGNSGLLDLRGGMKKVCISDVCDCSKGYPLESLAQNKILCQADTYSIEPGYRSSSSSFSTAFMITLPTALIYKLRDLSANPCYWYRFPKGLPTLSCFIMEKWFPSTI